MIWFGESYSSRQPSGRFQAQPSSIGEEQYAQIFQRHRRDLGQSSHDPIMNFWVYCDH